MTDEYHNSNLSLSLQITSEEAMIRLGALLAKWIKPDSIIYLLGDLGAGKTTLVRGFLRAFSYSAAVKSPTFTLVEPYSLDNDMFYNYNKLELYVKPENDKYQLTDSLQYDTREIKVYHFDLYRLEDAEELEYMGIRDYFDGQAIAFIEWPQKGYGVLPSADIIINIVYQKQIREVTILPQSENGELIVAKLMANTEG